MQPFVQGRLEPDVLEVVVRGRLLGTVWIGLVVDLQIFPIDRRYYVLEIMELLSQ